MDLDALVKSILGALRPILAKWWRDIEDYAESEAKKMAETLANITRLRAAGKIDDAQALALVDMQKHSMQAVLLTVEGIGLIAAQQATNAVIDAVRDAVNGALGFPLMKPS